MKNDAKTSTKIVGDPIDRKVRPYTIGFLAGVVSMGLAILAGTLIGQSLKS